MRAAVITFPGSNCDDDAVDTLSRLAGFQTDRVWHKEPASFDGYDLVVLPGGFSYGDYLRCGAIAALSPVMEGVKAFAESGGFVLGICNGFQILCESRLLPGSLTMNEGRNFICQDTLLKTAACRAPWTSEMQEGENVNFPIAHGDGRYWIDAEGLARLQKNRQILFTYAQNPNGSTADIAGICNEEGNVFGLMPHPERATELRSQDGKKLWASVAKAVQGIRR
jgi:phosphoribosylformylglycinamidine synthase